MSKKKPTPHPAFKTPSAWRQNDPALSWISQDFPQLEHWRKLAIGWLGTLRGISPTNLQTISLFLDRYLTQGGLPIDPAVLLRKDTQVHDFFELACPKSKAGVYQNNLARSFMGYVLKELLSLSNAEGKKVLDPNYHNPIPKRHPKTFQIIPDRNGVRRYGDINLTWVQQDFPQLEAWRGLAVPWLMGIDRGIGCRLRALSLFLKSYLVGLGLPLDPGTFLSRSTHLPDFYTSVCRDSPAGIKSNNLISEFLDFVLLKICSEPDDFERPVVSAAFWNPVKLRSRSGRSNRYESVHSPLCYGYIDALRRILAAGTHFRDWTWAQNAVIGEKDGMASISRADWFQVTEAELDRTDPDCVWRVRKRVKRKGGDVLEMWSPVRWVALLTKLILPLRTFQVLMLDSGEADTYRYEAGEWVENLGSLRRGSPGHSWHQGVFNRVVEQDGAVMTRLFANTNKTADIGKTGKDKGFTFPWPVLEDETGNPFYWLEKLRNWQEKYNPIRRLARWDEMGLKHLIEAKSDVQLAGYPDTAFLFRARDAKPAERHLPVWAFGLNGHWYKLLKALEDRLASQGEIHANGIPIRFVQPYNSRSNRGKTTYFPLHSLRVSLITALVQEGEVLPEILQKVVGHSRLLMTFYYMKFGETFIRQKMEDGLARLEAKKDSSITNWLANSEHRELLKKAICISPESLGSAIPVHPGNRNPAGWELMADGCCLMGGNTSPLEANLSIGGCFNGGPEIGGGGHGPVPGGTRNCIRCRWFVTMPHHLTALQIRFDNISYREFENRKGVQAHAKNLQDLENDRHDAEVAKVPFNRFNELRLAKRQMVSSIARWQDLILDLSAGQSLAQRCALALLEASGSEEGCTKLISAGSAIEVKCVLEETDSELLQLSRVCEGLEVYPDLPRVPGAVFRRSQLLDAALQNEGHAPLFLHLPEKVQLLAGNAWFKAMSRRANPSDPELGGRKVVDLFDSRLRLLEHLGFDASECLPDEVKAVRVAKPTKTNGRRRHVLHDQHTS